MIRKCSDFKGMSDHYSCGDLVDQFDYLRQRPIRFLIPYVKLSSNPIRKRLLSYLEYLIRSVP